VNDVEGTAVRGAEEETTGGAERFVEGDTEEYSVDENVGTKDWDFEDARVGGSETTTAGIAGDNIVGETEDDVDGETDDDTLTVVEGAVVSDVLDATMVDTVGAAAIDGLSVKVDDSMTVGLSLALGGRVFGGGDDFSSVGISEVGIVGLAVGLEVGAPVRFEDG